MKQKIALWIINRLLKWIPDHQLLNKKEGFHLHRNPQKGKKTKP